MGDAAPPLLLTSILGGYLALHLCHFTQRRWEAQEWERNLFEATALGALIFVLVRVVLSPLETTPAVAPALRWLRNVLPFPYAGSVLLTLAGGTALGLIGRLLMSAPEAVRRVAKSYGGEMLSLLVQAAQDRTPIMLTLRSRKVYVGLVIAAPGIQSKRHHIKILPTLSGYRREPDLRVTFTTPYWRVYEALHPASGPGSRSHPTDTPSALDHAVHRGFGLVVPLGEVISASRFDAQIHDQHFSESARAK